MGENDQVSATTPLCDQSQQKELYTVDSNYVKGEESYTTSLEQQQKRDVRENHNPRSKMELWQFVAITMVVLLFIQVVPILVLSRQSLSASPSSPVQDTRSAVAMDEEFKMYLEDLYGYILELHEKVDSNQAQDINGTVATKQELKSLKAEVKSWNTELKSLKAELKSLKTELEGDVQELHETVDANQVQDTNRTVTTEQELKSLNTALGGLRGDVQELHEKVEANAQEIPKSTCQYVANYVEHTWSDHRLIANARQCTLASIHNQEENELVASFAAREGKLFFIGGVRIPGTDNDRDGSAATWIWNDGSPWDFTNWGSGEPNNDYDVYKENRLEIRPPGTWNDLPEGTLRPAVYRCCK